MTALARMLVVRDTAAGFTSSNPVLRSGEMGVETDTDKLKIGDGVTVWTGLAYVGGGAGGGGTGTITAGADATPGFIDDGTTFVTPPMPYGGTLIGWAILGGIDNAGVQETGSATFDVRKATTLAGIGSATSIVAAAPPTITSAQAVESTTLTGWTTAFNAGDIFVVEFDSTSSFRRCTLTLYATKV